MHNVVLPVRWTNDEKAGRMLLADIGLRWLQPLGDMAMIEIIILVRRTSKHSLNDRLFLISIDNCLLLWIILTELPELLLTRGKTEDRATPVRQCLDNRSAAHSFLLSRTTYPP
jgi:hypothetical protein